MKAFQDIFARFGIAWATPIVCLLLAFGGIGGVMSWISGPSRGLLWTAQEGEIPPILAKTNKNGVQVSILIVQGAIVTILSLAYFVMADVSVAFFLLSADDDHAVPDHVHADVRRGDPPALFAAGPEAQLSRAGRDDRHVDRRRRWLCRRGVLVPCRLFSADATAGREPDALCLVGRGRDGGIHRPAAADRNAETIVMARRQPADLPIVKAA